MIKESPTLSISLEMVCFVVVKAREFDAKDALSQIGLSCEEFEMGRL